MDEIGHQQDSLSQDWQRIDARVLGQILAAQNLMFVLPDEARIAEFFSEALNRLPGITSCFVCLGNIPIPVGEASQPCSQCTIGWKYEGSVLVMPSHVFCALADQEGLRSIRIGTHEHTFGFFIFHTDTSGVIEPYWPFLENLANYVALSLENRLQKLLLEKARDELEERVKQRTEELKQMNERFTLAVRAANLGVWDWDIQKNELVWDDRMCELYGITREDFTGAYDDWLKGVHPDDRSISDQILKQTQYSEWIFDTEFRVVWPDNSIHYLKAYGQFAPDTNGNPSRLIGINFDITDRKRAEEEVHQFNQQLEQRVAERTAQLEAANKELESFAYSISHDLRAPLRHINGFLQLLQQRNAGALDEQSRHYITTITDSAIRMGQLIDDLLSFSRLGRNEMSKRPVNLAGLVLEVIRQLEPEMKDRTIRWHIADLPIVNGDRAMLRVVLVNLIANAVKFTRGCSSAEIEIGCQPGEGAETIFFVRDNGAGFDMNYADKLFGVFQRLHRIDEFEGTGIGLANVRRIIHRHGGRTWAEGKINQGATFFFSLPQSIQGV